MNAENPRDPEFEALKDASRFAWLLNFEAVATVAGRDTALVDACH